MLKKMAALTFFVALAYLAPLKIFGATSELDIPYVPNGGAKQQLDLFLPDGKGFPTVMFVHGGSLTQGDRKEAPYRQIGEAFQKSGIGCAVISYRLADKTRWPAQPEDVAAAFAWLKRNIASRGGDRSKLFLVGHSSGALLVALVSSDEKYLKKFGLNLNDAAGCVPIGSLLTNWFDFNSMSEEQRRKLFERSYLNLFGNVETFIDHFPASHVNGRMPPILILIAEQEQYQPPILESAGEFAALSKKAGAQVEIEVLKDRNHMNTIYGMVKTDDLTLLRIIKFIRK